MPGCDRGTWDSLMTKAVLYNEYISEVNGMDSYLGQKDPLCLVLVVTPVHT
jgi:hypothetical protein